VMIGMTVKVTGLLAPLLTVTTTVTGPTGRVGTTTLMLVALQDVGERVIPPKVTVLAPWRPPKFVPEMVTGVPTGPELGERLVMVEVNTFNATVVLCVKVPSVPVMVSVELPVGVEAVVETVRVEEPEPLVTETGLKLAVAPAGNPLALSETVPV